MLNTNFLDGIAKATSKIELSLVYASYGQDLEVLDMNASFRHLSEIYGLPIDDLFFWLRNDKYQSHDELISAIQQLHTIQGESSGISPEGKRFHVEWSISTTYEKHLVCCIRDIRWRQKYKDQWTLFERVFNSSRSAIVVTDENNRIVLVNKYFEEISGYSKFEVLGKDPGVFGSNRQSKEFYQKLWRSLQDDGYWSGVIWNKRKDGRVYPEQKTIYAVNNENGVLTHFFSSGVILNNINEKPNEHSTDDNLLSPSELAAALRTVKKQHKNPIGILYIGIDRMDEANKACGLSFGDHILKIIINRLKDTFLPSGLISRSMGDEFIVAAPMVSTVDIASNLGSMLLKSLNSYIRYDDIEWKISVSIGMSFITANDNNWQIIEQAHIAMHHAKENGGNSIQFYDIDSQNNARKSLQLEQALKYAIEIDELSLNYQPIVSIDNQEIIGAEALLRWHSHEFGTVGPDRFIPIAEQSNLILEIGIWVFKKACDQLNIWGDNYTGSIAVNLSAHQIQYPDLPSKLLSILDEKNIPMGRIHLEITETAMINDTNSAVSVVSSLREAGFILSMDDFGTGYSSLSYLTRFPIDKLKIDRSFIQTITTSRESLLVTKSIINLAKSLGLRVVAEGVETACQLNELNFLDCDYVQGYFFSKPLEADSFITLYKEQYSSVDLINPHLLSAENAS